MMGYDRVHFVHFVFDADSVMCNRLTKAESVMLKHRVEKTSSELHSMQCTIY